MFKLYFLALDPNDLYQNKYSASIVDNSKIHLVAPMVPSCVKDNVKSFVTKIKYPTNYQQRLAKGKKFKQIEN